MSPDRDYSASIMGLALSTIIPAHDLRKLLVFTLPEIMTSGQSRPDLAVGRSAGTVSIA